MEIDLFQKEKGRRFAVEVAVEISVSVSVEISGSDGTEETECGETADDGEGKEEEKESAVLLLRYVDGEHPGIRGIGVGEALSECLPITGAVRKNRR